MIAFTYQPISTTGALGSASRLFRYLHCDCIGPLPFDVAGQKYIVHFVDAFTKFSILVPSRIQKGQTIVDAILTHVFSVFGAPKSIHSDNGPEFSSRIFSLLCFYLNMEHSLSIPHFHQSNRLVERANTKPSSKASVHYCSTSPTMTIDLITSQSARC
ncbi:hypothetical protein P9112_002499 [Eukaryota sp. TZLM1-RC]